MSLLKLKAKVLLSSEEEMEEESKYDFGNIAKSKEWVWKNIAVAAEDISKIIEYSKNKCIVVMDEEKILVAESFEDLFNRWEEANREDDIPPIVLEEDKN